MTVGERRLFTARVDEQGTWAPGICDPQAILGTPDGDAVLAEAEGAFGSLQPPAEQPITDPETSSGDADPVVVGTVAVAGVGLAVVLIAGAYYLLRRRRQPAS
jgi:hypothetical protein